MKLQKLLLFTLFFSFVLQPFARAMHTKHIREEAAKQTQKRKKRRFSRSARPIEVDVNVIEKEDSTNTIPEELEIEPVQRKKNSLLRKICFCRPATLVLIILAVTLTIIILTTPAVSIFSIEAAKSAAYKNGVTDYETQEALCTFAATNGSILENDSKAIADWNKCSQSINTLKTFRAKLLEEEIENTTPEESFETFAIEDIHSGGACSTPNFEYDSSCTTICNSKKIIQNCAKYSRQVPKHTCEDFGEEPFSVPCAWCEYGFDSLHVTYNCCELKKIGEDNYKRSCKTKWKRKMFPRLFPDRV